MPDIKDFNNEELEEIAGGNTPSNQTFEKGDWLRNIYEAYNNAKAYYVKDVLESKYDFLVYKKHNDGKYIVVEASLPKTGGYVKLPNKPNWITENSA